MTNSGLEPSLLVVGNRRNANDADNALGQLAPFFSSFCFLYEGAILEEGWAVPFSRRWVKKNSGKWDILYFRADWFDSLLQKKIIFWIIDVIKPQKVVFGYHCHLCANNGPEADMFERADALVLLNDQSENYFTAKYTGCERKPIFNLRSLYLPARKFYGNYPSDAMMREISGNANICLSGSTNRLGSLPVKQNRIVPDLMYAHNRYDYFRMLRILGTAPRLNIEVFGMFPSEHGIDGERVRQLYRESCPRVAFRGRLSGADFSAALSVNHASLLAGFLPREVPPPFENMNYQLRYNTLISCGVLPVISAGVAKIHEEEIRETGYGLIVETMDDLLLLHERLKEVFPVPRRVWELVVSRNCFDEYAYDLSKFFKKSKALKLL